MSLKEKRERDSDRISREKGNVGKIRGMREGKEIKKKKMSEEIENRVAFLACHYILLVYKNYSL